MTDNHGVSAVSDPLTVVVGGVSPTATIDSPSPTLIWKVGDTITFSGHATDPQDGTLPASALSWTLLIRHCPANCHTHTVQTFPGVASGSFSAPDHEYPSSLELKLTAINSNGLTHTKTVALNPQTVLLTFQSNPSGMPLTVATGGGTTPFVQTVIVGSEVTIQASPTQTPGRDSLRVRLLVRRRHGEPRNRGGRVSGDVRSHVPRGGPLDLRRALAVGSLCRR